jgi:hypothetical protein
MLRTGKAGVVYDDERAFERIGQSQGSATGCLRLKAQITSILFLPLLARQFQKFGKRINIFSAAD